MDKLKNKYLFFSPLVVLLIIVFLPVFRHLLLEAQDGRSLYSVDYYQNLAFENCFEQNVKMEYPPLAGLFFSLPLLFSDQTENYATTFKIILLVIVAITMLLSLVLLNKSKKQLAWRAVLTLPFLLILTGPAITDCFDIFPAFLVILSIICLIERLNAVSWIILGLATCTKVYPVILVPLFCVYLFRQYKIKPFKIIYSQLPFFLLGMVLPALPYFFLSRWDDLIYFIQYHATRGIQNESVWASLINLLGFWKLPSSVNFEYGSQTIHSVLNPVLINIIPLIMLFVFSLIYLHISKTLKEAKTSIQKDSLLIWGTFLAILVFIIFNKVLSPAFLTWLILIFPLLQISYSREKFNQLFFHLAVICFLTFITSPVLFGPIKALEENALIVLLARNLLLVWLFIRLLPNPLSTNVKIKTQ